MIANTNIRSVLMWVQIQIQNTYAPVKWAECGILEVNNVSYHYLTLQLLDLYPHYLQMSRQLQLWQPNLHQHYWVGLKQEWNSWSHYNTRQSKIINNFLEKCLEDWLGRLPMNGQNNKQFLISLNCQKNLQSFWQLEIRMKLIPRKKPKESYHSKLALHQTEVCDWWFPLKNTI